MRPAYLNAQGEIERDADKDRIPFRHFTILVPA
jgi:hypothetical protein